MSPETTFSRLLTLPKNKPLLPCNFDFSFVLYDVTTLYFESFRISKSDLEMRPIYHHKEESIKNHVLICFMCLAISVYLELKTKYSIKEIVHQIRNVADIRMESKITGKIISIRGGLSTEVKEIMELSY